MDVTGLLEWDVLRWVMLVLGVWLVAAVLRALLRKPDDQPHRAQARCACGWTGTVSKLKPRCSKCGAPLTLP